MSYAVGRRNRSHTPRQSHRAGGGRQSPQAARTGGASSGCFATEDGRCLLGWHNVAPHSPAETDVGEARPVWPARRAKVGPDRFPHPNWLPVSSLDAPRTCRTRTVMQVNEAVKVEDSAGDPTTPVVRHNLARIRIVAVAASLPEHDAQAAHAGSRGRCACWPSAPSRPASGTPWRWPTGAFTSPPAPANLFAWARAMPVA